MPWHIGKSEDCPASKPYAVIKDSDGSVAGCHETESKAKKQLAALYSSERKAMPQITALPIKAEQVGTAKWRVLAIPFGGPFKGRDMDGEFFSPKTDIKPHWFAERPVLWHHGQDETKDEPDDTIGVEEDLAKESDGWWADMWLDRSNRYWQQVSRMLAAGKVYGSSGALHHIVRKAPDGEILVWPHIEQTLTTIPANPFARIVPVKALDHFTSAGITVDEESRGLFTEPDQTPDLGPTLPQGGKDPAAARLVVASIRVRELLRRFDD
jgi:hypothetical protein